MLMMVFLMQVQMKFANEMKAVLTTLRWKTNFSSRNKAQLSKLHTGENAWASLNSAIIPKKMKKN